MVKEGKENEFIQTWERFARWTQQYRRGVVYGRLLQDIKDSRRFVTWGPWEDLESLQAWRETVEFQQAFQRFNELCTEIHPLSLRSITLIGTGMEQESIPEQDISCL
ncbi:MAG: antibiotic biosynthesis monooxygenase [Methanomicrobiales archaeon]|nr:antibiotic biosynthesis monooxygenase [Methanomicrobiales archaeon]